MKIIPSLCLFLFLEIFCLSSFTNFSSSHPPKNYILFSLSSSSNYSNSKWTDSQKNSRRGLRTCEKHSTNYELMTWLLYYKMCLWPSHHHFTRYTLHFHISFVVASSTLFRGSWSRCFRVASKPRRIRFRSASPLLANFNNGPTFQTQ